MGLIQNKVKVSQPVSHIIIENAGGLQGPAGAPGQPGPQGEPGPAGKDGQDGAAATIAVGSTTTLPAGSEATVTNSGTSSEAVFNFAIPKGDKGDKGDAGAGLVITGSVATYADLPTNLTPADAGKAYFVQADGKLYVWSGTQFPAEGEGSQFEGPQGPAGADGQAATITAGTTTTLPAGSSATVTNSGTTSAAVFNFGIPAGADGATGPAGPANTLSIGTVQGGDTAAATITGTAPNQTLNLTLPKGDQGDPGPEPELFRNVTGTNIELTDAGSSVKSLNYIYGDTEQETVSGKNLANYNTSGTNNFNIGDVESGKTYTISFNLLGSLTGDGGLSLKYGSAGTSIYTWWQPVAGHKKYTFTATTSATVYYNAWGTGAGAGSSNIMLEEGSEESQFEPYVGGVPSPNPGYPQAVQTVTGEQTITISDGDSQTQTLTVDLTKNLFTTVNISGVTDAFTDNHYSSSTSRTTTQDWVKLKAGTYTFNATTGTGKTLNISTVTANTDGSILIIPGITGQWMSLPCVFTITQDILWKMNLRFSDNSNISPADVSDIQLEKGSTATTYEPPVELCKIGTYQDYIYKSGGDWYIHKEVGIAPITSSDASWYRQGSAHPNGFTATFANVWAGGTVNLTSSVLKMSNYYHYEEEAWTGGNGAFGITSTGVLWLTHTSDLSLADFKTWLDTYQPKIYAPLATATETQITDATLISQLNALDSATLYNGNTYIQVTSTDIPGELDLDYWTYFHRNVETVDIEDGAVTTPKVADGAITAPKVDFSTFDNKMIWFNDATVSNTVGSYTQTTIDSKQITIKAGRYFVFAPFSVNRTAGTSMELALNITFTGTGLTQSVLGGRVPAISGYSFTARSGTLIVPTDQTVTVNYTYGAQNAGGAFSTTQFYAALIRIANS